MSKLQQLKLLLISGGKFHMASLCWVDLIARGKLTLAKETLSMSCAWSKHHLYSVILHVSSVHPDEIFLLQLAKSTIQAKRSS